MYTKPNEMEACFRQCALIVRLTNRKIEPTDNSIAIKNVQALSVMPDFRHCLRHKRFIAYTLQKQVHISEIKIKREPILKSDRQ